jgi:hypothetical protein
MFRCLARSGRTIDWRLTTAAELGRLKGEFEALERESNEKNCGPASAAAESSDIAPPRQQQQASCCMAAKFVPPRAARNVYAFLPSLIAYCRIASHRAGRRHPLPDITVVRLALCISSRTVKTVNRMALSDAFRVSPATREDIHQRRHTALQLQITLGIPRDQTMPFARELMEAVAAYVRMGGDFSNATLARAPDQLARLGKAAARYATAIEALPVWLRQLVDDDMLPRQSRVAFSFAPSFPRTVGSIAKEVRATAQSANLVASALRKVDRPQEKGTRGRRPKRRPGDAAFTATDQFVSGLLTIAKRRRATKVTTDKNDGGTLDQFFDEAAKLKLWPPGFRPRLSPSRLYRLHQQWKADNN